MKYCKGHFYYFGKKDMSLLGMMEVRWKVDVKISVFEYSFVVYLINGYYGQDYVQVAAVTQLAS